MMGQPIITARRALRGLFQLRSAGGTACDPLAIQDAMHFITIYGISSADAMRMITPDKAKPYNLALKRGCDI
jgi:hypothetical protein